MGDTERALAQCVEALQESALQAQKFDSGTNSAGTKLRGNVRVVVKSLRELNRLVLAVRQARKAEKEAKKAAVA